MSTPLQTKLEALQEYIDDKLYEILPGWALRLGDNIKMSYRAIISSFRNWKDGYGFFPDSDLWSLDSTISKFVLPRLRKFIDGPSSNVCPSNLTPENWKEVLTKMQVAFMEEEEWFRWKYPNVKHPLWDTEIDSSIPFLVDTENPNLKALNPERDKQYNWDEVTKYMTEYQKEYEEGCQLLGKYFGSLWW